MLTYSAANWGTSQVCCDNGGPAAASETWEYGQVSASDPNSRAPLPIIDGRVLTSAPLSTSHSADGSDPQATGTPQTGDLLYLGSTESRQITGGSILTFRFNLELDQYGRIEVAQHSIRVVVSLFGPDGGLLIPMDAGNSELWRESVSYIAR